MELSSSILDELYSTYLPCREGKIADYIPELAKANADHFAIAVTDVSGVTREAGDSRTFFTLQSLSKPFVYGLALEDHGPDGIRKFVGVEPTGEAFNSIIELESQSLRSKSQFVHQNAPANPMINSGAIAVTGAIQGENPSEKLNRILHLFSNYAGHPVHVDVPVFLSERSTGHRNRAIAHLLRHFEVLGSDIDAILDLYFQQCSILTNARELSIMAATLANGGVNPISRSRVVRTEYVRDLLSLMLSCGMYDSSGEWSYHVGLPAKSGVSGGIFAVVPGKMGIAVYSPLLDPRGHCVRGLKVFRELSSRFKLSIFEPRPEPRLDA